MRRVDGVSWDELMRCCHEELSGAVEQALPPETWRDGVPAQITPEAQVLIEALYFKKWEESLGAIDGQ